MLSDRNILYGIHIRYSSFDGVIHLRNDNIFEHTRIPDLVILNLMTTHNLLAMHDSFFRDKINSALLICKQQKSLNVPYGWALAVAESTWDIPYLNRKMFLFCYQIFKSDFFLSSTFPISLSDFTMELLSKNLITK